MRLTGPLSRTSKYFQTNFPCLSLNPTALHPHYFLKHPLFQKNHVDWKEFYAKNDLMTRTNTDIAHSQQMKLKLVRLLGKNEQFYQNNLSKLFHLYHECLPNDWITDLSNRDVLIEIKNVKNFRSAYGQCMQYSAFRPHAKKIIILFGKVPSEDVMRVNVQICEKLDIELVWVWCEEIYFWMKEETIVE